MYQHDIKETRLAKTLNDIVTECVSFVGKKAVFPPVPYTYLFLEFSAQNKQNKVSIYSFDVFRSYSTL